MKISRLVLTCFYFLTLFSLIACTKNEEPTVTIENMFIKELPPGQTTAAAYMKIKNTSKISQPVNYVHSPIADHIEVHRNIYQDGMMQMRPVKKLTISPGETRVLEPGGFHLMMFGIYDDLKVGDTFEVTFEFDTGLVITTNAEVKSH